MPVLLVRADGTQGILQVPCAGYEDDGSPFPSLDALRAHVDYRWFEVVALPRAMQCVLVVDEEGWLRDNPQPNPFACLLTGQSIAGDVFLWGPEIDRAAWEGAEVDHGHDPDGSGSGV